MVKKSKKKPKKKNLPISQPQKNQGAPHRTVATATAQSFSGPLPPPQILEKYNGHTPFFLSGGITSEDAKSIKEINHPKFTGVDLNSGFEDNPGLKNIENLNHFIREINK